MRAIQAVTERFRERGLDLTHIRFPNEDKPLSGCDIGKLIYVFADGALAVCPYIVFAAPTPQSKYPDTDFLVGNIFENDVAPALDGYDFHSRYTVGSNIKCGVNSNCGKGCPAAIISRGGYIGDVDNEQCPVPDGKPLLQIERRGCEYRHVHRGGGAERRGQDHDPDAPRRSLARAQRTPGTPDD